MGISSVRKSTIAYFCILYKYNFGWHPAIRRRIMTLMGGDAGLRPEICGFTQRRFGKVKDAFADNFSAAHACHETGATFSAHRGDECLVHLWGGHADKAKT